MPKSRQTKVKGITQATKEKVWRRQKGLSILSNRPITVAQCCCHYIGRGVRGVGYEWNIVGLTPEEHRLLDENKPIPVNNRKRWTNAEAQILIKNHLILNYIGWSEEACEYDKYKFSEEEYGVKPREIPVRRKR